MQTVKNNPRVRAIVQALALGQSPKVRYARGPFKTAVGNVIAGDRWNCTIRDEETGEERRMVWGAIRGFVL